MHGKLFHNIKSLSSRRPVLFLFFIFVLSVIIRLPQLARPLSKHFESNTAFVLISSDIWQKQGFEFSKGAPVHKYGGEFNIPASLYNETLPRLYNSGTYLSMGPGSYWLPYGCFSLFHQSPSVAGIRLLNLVLQFISILLVFQLTLAFFKQRSIAVTAGIVAIFSPVSMWFQGNAYCHEVTIIPLYLGLLLSVYNLWTKTQLTANRLIGFALLLYAAVLTDWLALFLCVPVLGIQLWQKARTGAWNLSLIITMSIVSLLAVMTILFIYSNTVGWQELKAFINASFLHRSVLGATTSSTRNSIANIFIYIFAGYGPVMFLVIAGLIKENTRRFLLNAHPVLIIAILAPALHYLVFYNFANEHDYAALKWIGIFPALAALTVHASWKTNRVAKSWVMVICVLSNCILFQLINFPGKNTRKGEPYNWQQQAGSVIAANSAANDYIFTNQAEEFKPMNWYAKRETLAAKDSMEAQQLLNRLPGHKAVYFEFRKGDIVKIIRLKEQ